MCVSFPSPIRTPCAKRSRMVCLPNRSTISSNCMPLRAPREADRRWLRPRRHGFVGRLHYALGSNGGRRAERPRANGIRLWHVYRRFWPSLWPAAPWMHDDSCGFGQYRAPDSDDSSYGSTVLVATPSYAMHVCEVGEKMGVDWRRALCASACSVASPARLL